MKLFESAFFDNFKYFERYYDTELKKSASQQFESTHEYFVPNSNGNFTLITDPSVKLSRVEGTSKQSKDQIGSLNPIYKHIRDFYWKTGTFNENPRIFYLDIETRAINPPDPANAPEQITLIQIIDSESNTALVFGLRAWSPESDYILDVPVRYLHCKSEIQLIDSFLKVFNKLDPLVIYAWNGNGFDFPYLYNRIKKLGLDTNRLSNYGTVELKEKFNEKTKKTSNELIAPGHYYLDMMELYKKYVLKPRPSYSLDSIAEIEVHANKVEHDEFPTFDSFYTGERYTIEEQPYTERIRESIRQGMIRRRSLPKDSAEYIANENAIIKDINFQFVYYGIRDVELLKKIDIQINISKITVNIAKMMGVLYNDVLGTVKPWGQYISNVAFLEHKVMPKKDVSDGKSYKGAYVRDPVTGRHRWVMNFDVNSMYPQYSIAGFGMSPENIIPMAKMPPDLRDIVQKYFTNDDEYERMSLTEQQWAEITPVLQKYNVSITVNGVVFSKDNVGIVPRLVNEIYDGRKRDKKTMYKYEAFGIKVQEILKSRGVSV